VSEPYYSQRAQCLRLSERFFIIIIIIIIIIIALKLCSPTLTVKTVTSVLMRIICSNI